MALYVDTSAWLKRYVDEVDSDAAQAYLEADSDWFTGRHTYVELRRNIARVVAPDEHGRIRELFEADWRRTRIIEIDDATARLAADIAELTGTRSLDALHLGAASRLGPDVLRLLTFDIRQAQAARSLHFTVFGC